MSIAHWLNTTLVVWRQAKVSDGAGGYTLTYESQGSVACKVDQSSAAERVLAQQAGASHTHNIYFNPDADVQRHDRLAASGVDPNTTRPYYEVEASTSPSTAIYLKAQAERVEAA